MFEIDKKKFGAFVAELRREKGYTQRELAEKLFVSDKAVSKWETAVSIPDTALLIPLAELLGVTVTELLMCQRVCGEASMDTEQVEGIVKTAIHLTDEKAERAYQTGSRWPLLYVCSLILGMAGTAFCWYRQLFGNTLFTVVALGMIFGAYFCFAVKTRLPVFYDENRLGFYYDGIFRMNVPGIRLNNSNWPHLVQVGRIWSCALMVLYPPLQGVLCWANKALWGRLELWVCLALVLGGLFIPFYVVGKKYQ